MNKIFIFTLLFLISSVTFSQSPQWLWAKKMGSIGEDQGLAIATDNSGNVITFGRFEGLVDFDPGPGVFNFSIATSTDGAFISKLDASGNFIWAKGLFGPVGSTCIGYDMALDPSGSGALYVTGVFSGTVDFDPGAGTFDMTSSTFQFDVFVCKLDIDGNFIWAKQVSAPGNQYAWAVTFEPGGNGAVYVTGWFDGTADFDTGPGIFLMTSAGSQDIFVLKLSSSGNFLWAKQLGGTQAEDAQEIAVDPAASHDVVLTGNFYGTADFDPGTGVTNLVSAGYQDAFICKLDSSGSLVWVHAFSGTVSETGANVTIDPSGNVYSTGSFISTVDFDPGPAVFNLTSSWYSTYISKLTASGNFVWAKQISATSGGNVGCNALELSSNGDIFLGGGFQYTTDFDPGPGTFNVTTTSMTDAFVCKWDNNANFLWVATAGGNNAENVASVALDGQGNIYTAGLFRSPVIHFSADSLINAVTAATTFDIFVARLDSLATGVSEIENLPGRIQIYPNPSDGKFTIAFPQAVHEVSLCIYSLSGEKIYEENISGMQKEIRLQNPKPGIYFVKVSDGEKVFVKKMVAQR